ncbi:type II toxin-antitoxin system mRNA interferase RelE [Microlunatus spumicola]|uniref:Type II toxin-antitoxin system mRNA interferase RelE n=1 Tax=Microlunatus spumicola TaxID=81499 RepID=A0ABP6WHH4_9ACTN
MSWSVEISPAARRSLKRLPEKVRDAVLAFVHGPLTQDPHRVGTPLERQLAGLHSARRGSYRVVYRIVDERVLVQVVTVGPRSDVYR